MHYSRIQNVTPADSRGVRQSDLRARGAARREEEPGEVQAVAPTASRLRTGGPPVLSTRCNRRSF